MSRDRRAELMARMSAGFSRNMEAADRFLSCAEHTRGERSQHKLAGFFVHQAVETVYRSLIKALDGYDKKCHQIRALQKDVRICAPQFQAVFSDRNKEERRLLDLLEDCYLRGRYDETFTISGEDLDALITKAGSLRESAERIVAGIT